MNQTLADISVIIPAYNRAGLIGETLRSLLNQTAQAKEIIVVDDGSTDGTVEAVLRYAAENGCLIADSGGSDSKAQPVLAGAGREDCQRQPRGEDERERMSQKLKISEGKSWPEFKVLRQENAGPGSARNRGLTEATGDFIHFFDSDDIAAPNKHEVQLRALLESGVDIAYGPWVKGHFAPVDARRVASGELRVASLNSENTRYQLPATLYSGFIPEGPILQARGLPKGDWVRALLTNWSIVPHACLFRRSILEKVGGFPEDIWVGEDQLLFLRCLLAGAKVVHTPETMVFYRLGDDPGKLTATGAPQKRHARDWARFLVKANQEVKEKAETLKSEVVKAPATSYSLPATNTPSSWFGFRLRAYEGWRDLEKFFPHGEDKLKNELQGIWKRSQFSVFSFQFSGFVLRKLGGLKLRVLGYREHASFRCSKYSVFVAERCLAVNQK